MAGDGFFGEEGLGPAARLGNVPFVLGIVLYRVMLSPFLGRQCRFEPTCSLYGLVAYRRYGPIRGTWMTLRRVGRCHPFHRGGYDPVPFPTDGEDGKSGESRETGGKESTDGAGAVGCASDGDGEKAERSGDSE